MDLVVTHAVICVVDHVDHLAAKHVVAAHMIVVVDVPEDVLDVVILAIKDVQTTVQDHAQDVQVGVIQHAQEHVKELVNQVVDQLVIADVLEGVIPVVIRDVRIPV